MLARNNRKLEQLGPSAAGVPREAMSGVLNPPGLSPSAAARTRTDQVGRGEGKTELRADVLAERARRRQQEKEKDEKANNKNQNKKEKDEKKNDTFMPTSSPTIESTTNCELETEDLSDFKYLDTDTGQEVTSNCLGISMLDDPTIACKSKLVYNGVVYKNRARRICRRTCCWAERGVDVYPAMMPESAPPTTNAPTVSPEENQEDTEFDIIEVDPSEFSEGEGAEAEDEEEGSKDLAEPVEVAVTASPR